MELDQPMVQDASHGLLKDRLGVVEWKVGTPGLLPPVPPHVLGDHQQVIFDGGVALPLLAELRKLCLLRTMLRRDARCRDASWLASYGGEDRRGPSCVGSFLGERCGSGLPGSRPYDCAPAPSFVTDHRLRAEETHKIFSPHFFSSPV